MLRLYIVHVHFTTKVILMLLPTTLHSDTV